MMTMIINNILKIIMMVKLYTSIMKLEVGQQQLMIRIMLIRVVMATMIIVKITQ